MKKQKVKFMDKIEFSSSEYAKELYKKETKRLRFKIICACVSLLTPLIWVFALCADSIGVPPTTNSQFIDDILEYFFSGLFILGIAATIISNPIQIIKTTLKLAAFGWFIIPFVFADIIAAIICVCASVISLLMVPTLHCAIGIYQSYSNKKDAEVYCMLNNVEV